jgi:hypothetical protein
MLIFSRANSSLQDYPIKNCASKSAGDSRYPSLLFFAQRFDADALEILIFSVNNVEHRMAHDGHRPAAHGPCARLIDIPVSIAQ